MKQPIISNLNGVTQEMIDSLEVWLRTVKRWKQRISPSCPFEKMGYMCEITCSALFEGYDAERASACPCYHFGKEATILAFTIICDVWKVYHKEGKP